MKSAENLMMKINICVLVSSKQMFKSEFDKHVLPLPECQTVMCCLLLLHLCCCKCSKPDRKIALWDIDSCRLMKHS